jgi:hypothetical protein
LINLLSAIVVKNIKLINLHYTQNGLILRQIMDFFQKLVIQILQQVNYIVNAIVDIMLVGFVALVLK